MTLLVVQYRCIQSNVRITHIETGQVKDAFVSSRPVARALVVLLFVGGGLLDCDSVLARVIAQIHDHRDALLPHELPQVGHCVRERPLAHDIERLTRIVIVLYIQCTQYTL